MHKTYGAKPLLFIKNSIWFPIFKCSLTILAVSEDIQDCLNNLFFFKSIIWCEGKLASLYLLIYLEKEKTYTLCNWLVISTKTVFLLIVLTEFLKKTNVFFDPGMDPFK